MTIRDITALQIFDSRGNPTVEAQVTLDDGTTGSGLVPSGASRGQYEAWELRDGDPSRYLGRSVSRAVANIETKIAPALRGSNALDQPGIDHKLTELDGTPNKSRLGANAILAVSLATATAAARSARVPVYEYLGGAEARMIPLPEIQIVGGGAHANFRCDVQDFMIMPVGAATAAEAFEIVFNVYHAAARMLRDEGKLTGVADEGGFWPDFPNHDSIFEFLHKSIEAAGYQPGREVVLSLDIAATELYDTQTRRYRFHLENREFTSESFAQLMADWARNWNVVSIEDPMADSDTEGWSAITATLGNTTQLIGDDLFTTNPTRIRDGIENHLANAVLIKLNQIGTLTETLEAIRLTKNAGWAPVISARSGETEDPFITHLAVATNAGQLKVGSFSRSERMAKWNEMLRIERALGSRAQFAGKQALLISGSASGLSSAAGSKPESLPPTRHPQ
ncbi:MAG: phosphopyruvate hydratase [Bryobacteraceae bacterium]|nr:phosphopyruvate hydratase [Bryobacteraceae bacterium]